MKVFEFIQNNQDILISPITEADFGNLTDGTALFQITCFKGNAPKEERNVRSAGYQMVAATTRLPDGEMEAVNLLGLTSNGFAKVDYVLPADIGKNGCKLLFRCRPLPLNDPRRNHHWNIA